MRRLLVLLMVLGGCAPAFKRQQRPPPSGLAVTTLTIAPIHAVGPAVSPTRVEELSHRVIATAVTEGQQFAIIGPEDAKATDVDDASWRGNGALGAVQAAGAKAEEALGLMFRLEQQLTESQDEVRDKAGRARVASNTVTTWVLEGRLTHPSTASVLLELRGSVLIDPFAEPSAESEFDPEPPLTALVEKMTAELVKAAQPYASRPRLSPLVEVGVTPRAIEPHVVAADALAEEAQLVARARYLNPQLPAKTAAQLAAAPPGLWVQSAAQGEALRAGDLVRSIDEQPATLARLSRLRHRATPAELVIEREGRAQPLIFPSTR